MLKNTYSNANILSTQQGKIYNVWRGSKIIRHIEKLKSMANNEEKSKLIKMHPECKKIT